MLRQVYLQLGDNGLWHLRIANKDNPKEHDFSCIEPSVVLKLPNYFIVSELLRECICEQLSKLHLVGNFSNKRTPVKHMRSWLTTLKKTFVAEVMIFATSKHFFAADNTWFAKPLQIYMANTSISTWKKNRNKFYWFRVNVKRR